MKPTMILGIVLIILGVIGLVYQGINYTTREPVDVLGIHFDVEKHKTFPIPAIVGGLALAGGVGLVVTASRKSAS